MKRVLLPIAAVLIPFLVIGALAQATEEKVYSCGSVETVVSMVQTHPSYAAHVVLTGEDANRGLQAAQPGAPMLERGLLVLRDDGALILFGFTAEGGCGHLLIQPANAEQFWKSIKGVGA